MPGRRTLGVRRFETEGQTEGRTGGGTGGGTGGIRRIVPRGPGRMHSGEILPPAAAVGEEVRGGMQSEAGWTLPPMYRPRL